MLAVFTITIFVNAFLLFLVQPMFARMVLPSLGGAAAVWNTAMVFYQAALLAGYGYAHVSAARLRVKQQCILHLGMMLLGLAALPISIPSGWKAPSGANPVPWLLELLTVAVGLPFFVISAGSPLLQRWFAETRHRHSVNPYFLYASGNLGSMLALLAYPLWVEPAMNLQQQGRVWAFAYGALILMMSACVAYVWMRSREAPNADRDPIASPEPMGIQAESTRDNPPVAAESQNLLTAAAYSQVRRRLRWVALAFVPSSLLLSVTTYITTDIAAVPLLWVIPLSIYLISFTLVFARRQLLPHILMIKALPIFVLPLVMLLTLRIADPLLFVIPLHLAVLFLVAMVCHGELSRDSPPANRLTEFYLFLSLGGVAGGAFNALVAPIIFNSLAEYPLVVVLSCLILPWASGPSRLLQRLVDFLLPLAIGLAGILLIIRLQKPGSQESLLGLAYLVGLPVLAYSFTRRPLRFGLSVGALFLPGMFFVGSQGQVIHSERSFFGVTRITLDPSHQYRQIMHGSTLHGKQAIDAARHGEPLVYYFRTGPLGQAFEALNGGGWPKRVGAVGLGAGSICAYARKGERWTVFEIDPVVKRIAEDPRFFTYLRDSPAELEVVLGDGRLSLARAADGSFDVLIMDAYSSDSVPVHLLTREALALYLSKLTPRGVLIFHITNRYLDLEPLLGNLAEDAGLSCLVRNDNAISPAESEQGKAPSKFLVMLRDRPDLCISLLQNGWAHGRTSMGIGAWTDSYSSILTVLRWHR